MKVFSILNVCLFLMVFSLNGMAKILDARPGNVPHNLPDQGSSYTTYWKNPEKMTCRENGKKRFEIYFSFPKENKYFNKAYVMLPYENDTSLTGYEIVGDERRIQVLTSSKGDETFEFIFPEETVQSLGNDKLTKSFNTKIVRGDVEVTWNCSFSKSQKVIHLEMISNGEFLVKSALDYVSLPARMTVFGMVEGAIIFGAFIFYSGN